MGDQRIRYGLAYGRMNNFITGSTDQTTRGYLAGTDGLFKQGDATPDVTNGYLFYTNNSGATTITHFDLQHPSAATVGSNSTNLAGLFEGKAIKIMFLDTNTTVAGSRVFTTNSDTTFAANSFLDLMYHNSGWYEVARSIPARSQAYSYTLGGSAGINVENYGSVIVSGESALVVVSLSGGYVGQSLYLTNNGSNQSITISTAGNIRVSHGSFVTTSGNQITINSGGTVEFYKASSTIWSLIGLL